MRRIIFSPVACLAVPHIFALSHKRQDVGGKKFLWNIKRVLIFSINFVSNIFHSKKN
jgi:hypothetical protein